MYSYSKIIQSELCMYWIWHSDWRFFEYEYKSCTQKFYNHKTRSSVLLRHSMDILSQFMFFLLQMTKGLMLKCLEICWVVFSTDTCISSSNIQHTEYLQDPNTPQLICLSPVCYIICNTVVCCKNRHSCFCFLLKKQIILQFRSNLNCMKKNNLYSQACPSGYLY